jgi:hypothetical protein
LLSWCRLRSAFVVRPMKRQRGSQNGDDGPFQASQPLRPDALHYASDLMVGFKYMKPEDTVANETLDDDAIEQLRMVHDSCSEKVELHEACREQSITPSEKMRSNITASTRKQLQDVANKHKKQGAEYISAWNTGEGLVQVTNSLGKDIDKEVIRLMRGGKPHSVSLFREDGCLGVKATKDIRKDMPILVDCGTLTEVQMFENMHNQDSMAHIVSTSVPSTLMQELGYSGPELMIETTQFANETRFLNDNFWAYSPYEMDANAGFFLIFDCVTAQPHIVLFALENIRKNHEIVISWGNEMWATICTKHVTAQAETSQWWALWSDTLLRTCRANGISVPPMKQETPLTTQLFFDANRRNHHGIYEYVMNGMVRQPSLGGALPLLQRLRTVDKGKRGELMRVVPVHQAMKRSNCKFINCVDASFLDKSIQSELKRCHKKKQERLYPDLVRLMEGAAPKVRVVEILDRSNPARFYTPPQITTFGVVAATKFRKGEYILCYWGRLRVAEDYANDSKGAESEWFPFLSCVLLAATNSARRYTFTIDNDQIPGYTGPQLVVENMTTGNEARFVNDKWQHPSGEANVEAVISWDDDKKVPVVGFTAIATIEEVRFI